MSDQETELGFASDMLKHYLVERQIAQEQLDLNRLYPDLEKTNYELAVGGEEASRYPYMGVSNLELKEQIEHFNHGIARYRERIRKLIKP